MSKVLSVPAVALHGLQMIEASAGTGKTWTIAALYLRLLLERQMPVEQILVVTYTNAATAELRGRIRARLVAAQQACVLGSAGDDVVLQDIFSRVERTRAHALLTLAIESFDLAAIHTIHGFCQRALAERAFESGLPFEFELASDDRRVLHEAMADFWRKEMAENKDALWLGWLLPKVAGPDALLKLLLPQFGKPYLRHDLPAPPDRSAGARFVASFARVQALWQKEGQAAIALLLQHPGMNGKSHSAEQIAKMVEAVEYCFAGAAALPLPEKLDRLGASRLKVNKGHEMPTHRVFDALDELVAAANAATAAFDAQLAHLQQRALQQCEANVRAARQRLSVRSFDDLLLDLYAALNGEGGAALAAALRRRYAAALIDEFQDTDPLQYGIFSRVFIPLSLDGRGARGEGGADVATCCEAPPHPNPSPSRGEGLCPPLFFVGDPKQAIYSFRGADLRAYLTAREQAGEVLRLDTNRRSSQALIESVNALFGRHPRPFLDEALQFEAVQAPPNAPAPIMLAGAAMPVLECWFVPRAGNELVAKKNGDLNLITKKRALPAIAAAVAGDIAALLAQSANGQTVVDDKGSLRALEGRDIAVLVASHHQGSAVHAALQAEGVASVRYGQESIFETHDALEVERILLAIAHPGREGLVRAALATRLMGARGDVLATLDGDAWIKQLDDFHRWHVEASEQGFIRMWHSWQREAGVAERLLALPDGERLMTNLLHLSDLLAALAHDEKLGIEALAKHLADARNDDKSESNSGEGSLLRLESDENLVRIVTIHTSKGLEYPVCYCPFLWDGGERKQEGPLRYHDPAADHQAALDFGSPQLEHNKDIAKAEQRAEALRLAYVALTRARQRCVLVWGAMKDADTSALAWLLYGEAGCQLATQDDSALRTALAQWDFAVCDLPAASSVSRGHASSHFGQKTLQARPWPTRIAPPWRMHSYSAWLTNTPERMADVDESPEHDAIAPLPMASTGAAEVSAFPCGANAGTCLHAMFERVDFTAPEATVIEAALLEHGFEANLLPVANALLHAALTTPMGDGLPALAAIPQSQQIREMEFMLPIAAPDMAALAAAIGAGQGADGRLAERVRSLQAAQLGGFLKGFVDLVFAHEERFYVLDYKSNHLGAHIADYATPALAAEMAAAMYDLQALLYTVALHHALAQRLPAYDYERHMGGSRYLFLRGMQPAVPGSGVFAWRPSRALVERVAACLATKEKVFA